MFELIKSLDELSKRPENSRIQDSAFSQPICTAIQVIIVNLLREWGVSPSAVTGQSSGEIAAAYACGAITMTEAIVAAYLRGFVTTRYQRPGVMATIRLSRGEVETFLTTGVVIACENSPASTTISGDEDKLGNILETIRASNPNILARLFF